MSKSLNEPFRCESCGLAMPVLDKRDEVRYGRDIRAWYCVRCSDPRQGEYVRILRRDGLGPERRCTER